MPSVEILFPCKSGGGGAKPCKSGKQEVADDFPTCGNQISKKGGDQNELKVALFWHYAVENQKSKKSQKNLNVEAGSTTIRAESPKADGVKGVAERNTGKVKEDGPRPDGVKLDGLVVHAKAKNKEKGRQHDG